MIKSMRPSRVRILLRHFATNTTDAKEPTKLQQHNQVSAYKADDKVFTIIKESKSSMQNEKDKE